ncbi:MAG TPA: polyprenyl synthetase family protein [Caulobacteraceae bacterium]|nr:polyprenyl synthetase family protein [Caulobacteraceae bacterium]
MIEAPAGRDGEDVASLVQSIMTECGAATRGAIWNYLPREARAPFLDELIADYPARGGKMMRPTICIANARAFGGRIADAVSCAAAIEILHNGLLIHDDIQDGSELRRGRPALHKLHGAPLAINAGDALILLALRPLLDGVRPLSSGLGERILDVTQSMARETAEGQALELGWRERAEVELGEADYLTMVLKKTAWLATIWPAQMGLLIGSRGEADPASVVRFGFFLGAAFQIEDDLRNLETSVTYGKELNGDLYEAKRTLMLIHARRSASAADRRTLDGFLRLRREERTDEEVRWVAALIRRQGSLEYGRTMAQAMAGAALHEFTAAYGHLPPSRDKSFIAALPTWVFTRP